VNSTKARQVSWWRLGLGLLLLLGGLKNLDQRNISPDLLPINQAEWAGWYFGEAAFIIVGLWLIIVGV
jgi:hypothetical protein